MKLHMPFPLDERAKKIARAAASPSYWRQVAKRVKSKAHIRALKLFGMLR